MKKRIIAVLMLVCMALGMMTACSQEMTPEKAQKIVLQHLGVKESDVEMHVHVGDHDGIPCYSIYVTMDGETKEYLVDSTTGEILEIRDSSHAH